MRNLFLVIRPEVVQLLCWNLIFEIKCCSMIDSKSGPIDTYTLFKDAFILKRHFTRFPTGRDFVFAA